MRKGPLTAASSVVLMIVATFAANAGQAGVNGHQKRVAHHATYEVTQNGSFAQHTGSQSVPNPTSEINNFSSSSVLHIGVNHPPKSR
jgi:hypothetical protein